MLTTEKKKKISIGHLQLDGVSLIGISDRVVESADQDQTARMCRLILLYTLRERNSLMMTERGFTLTHYHTMTTFNALEEKAF